MQIQKTTFNGKTWAVSPKPLPAQPGMVQHTQLTDIATGRRISIPTHLIK